MKSGQVTAFVLVGIVLVVIIGIVIFLIVSSTEQSIDSQIDAVNTERVESEPLMSYVRNCVSQGHRQALTIAMAESGLNTTSGDYALYEFHYVPLYVKDKSLSYPDNNQITNFVSVLTPILVLDCLTQPGFIEIYNGSVDFDNMSFEVKTDESTSKVKVNFDTQIAGITSSKEVEDEVVSDILKNAVKARKIAQIHKDADSLLISETAEFCSENDCNFVVSKVEEDVYVFKVYKYSDDYFLFGVDLG